MSKLSRLFRLLRLCAPGIALLLIVLARAGRAQPAPADSSAPAPIAAKPAPVKGGPAQKVTVGLYLQNIFEIDVRTNSFSAEFFMWFLWSGDIDPTLTFELANAVNVTELTKTPVFTDASGASAPETLPDGRHLQQFHVYGRFGHPFPLSKYPFDSHEITISLEDGRYSTDRLVYEIDAQGSTWRPELSIPGWNLSPMTKRVTQDRFPTNFGDPRSGRSDDTYSRAEFSVKIDRPAVGIFSKTVVPIAIIIIITFGAFFCQASDIDARLCLTITALISAVALQFTAQTELPPTGSLLLLDKIYILSYVAILLVTFACIAANRLANAEKPDAARLADRIGLWGIGFGYFALLAIFIMGAR